MTTGVDPTRMDPTTTNSKTTDPTAMDPMTMDPTMNTWVANIHRAGAGEPCARREYLVPLTLSEIATMTSEWAEGMFVLCKSCFTEQASEAGWCANSHRGEREHRGHWRDRGKGRQGDS